MLGMPHKSKAALTAMLKDAWTRSCGRGYTVEYSRCSVMISQQGGSHCGRASTSHTRLRKADAAAWHNLQATRLVDFEIVTHWISMLECQCTIGRCQCSKGRAQKVIMANRFPVGDTGQPRVQAVSDDALLYHIYS